MSMNAKYFVTTFRHLWRYRLFTGLNIFGLALSISACWIIFRIINFEYSYEKGLANQDRIYRVVSGFINDEKERYSGGVSKPVYQGVREQVEGLEYAVPVFGMWLKTVEVNYTNGHPLTIDDPTDIVATDSTYFSMLPYHWIRGSKSTAFQSPESVVLTESRAKKYFPGKNPDEIIHQIITYYSYSDTVQRTVTGIVADYATPTEFTAQEFCSLPTKAYELVEWTNTNGSDNLYLQFKPGANPDRVVAQIDTIAARKASVFLQGKEYEFKFKRWFKLLPLKESHFSTYIDEYGIRKANKRVLYGLGGIALFLLSLACINYINISVASIPQRAKEIGVRKTLGSSRFQLIGQFLFETMFTSIFAAILSLFFSLLCFWMLKDIIPPGITPLDDIWQLIVFIALLSIVITMLAGFYPSWLITRVKTINVFRSSYFSPGNHSGLGLQKVLIVFQFVIALGFITSSIIISKQLQYALTTEMGFNKDAVVLLNLPWKYVNEKKYANKQFALLNELKRIQGIDNVSLGHAPMGSSWSSGPMEYAQDGKEPKSRQVFKKVVDTAYIRLYNLKLLAGRNLMPSDTTNEYVINEMAAHAFGFPTPHDAIGKLIKQVGGSRFPIVGVVNDFHSQSFRETIDPMVFKSEKGNLNTFNIKLNKDQTQWQATLKMVEKKWDEVYPSVTFAYKFYDDAIAEMYKQEQHLAKLINLATILSIFISCLGLLGLVVLTTFQRTKEIGIRKVLGASVLTIVQLLSKEYLLLVVIATVIASPIAWLLMNKWLQHFAYRIEMKWWMFMLAGLAALMIAMITVSFHAMKAAIANPVKSLRTE